jgi:hypothetical protein
MAAKRGNGFQLPLCVLPIHATSFTKRAIRPITGTAHISYCVGDTSTSE